MLKLKLQYFSHMMWRADSFEKTLMLAKIDGRRRRGRKRMRWLNQPSLTQWTFVWINSGSWWWTVRPGVLQSMGSWRVWHNWATELNWSVDRGTWLATVHEVTESDTTEHLSAAAGHRQGLLARPLCPSPTPRIYSNSSPLSRWCHPTISFSVVPFFSCLQTFPASGSLQMSQLFASGDQNIGVSASVSVLPMNTQDWSPLGWTGWISLQSKWLSRAFSNTTVQNHQFFSTQLSL